MVPVRRASGPRFRLATGRPFSDPTPIGTLALGLGDTVRDSRGTEHRLLRRLGSGGEGDVFETDSRQACKVYHPGRLTRGTLRKLVRMVRDPIEHPSVCWPTDVVGQGSTPVGFLMPPARGTSLQRALFVRPAFEQRFPGWSRRELVRLAQRILAPIAALHAEGVLLGDINPLNILVEDADSVFLVDADSYQIEDMPCPVGTPTFLAPELLGRELQTVLRTPEQEHLAIATLLFMILVPGKAPYSHAGGGDPAENVRTRHFPYPLAEKRGRAVPAGPWRFIWSHLPYAIKCAFHEVFVDGRVLHVLDWLRLLEQYREDLQHGRVSADCFPAGLKVLSRDEVMRRGGRWAACSLCQSEFGTRGTDTICPTCRTEGVGATCAFCHKAFRTTRQYLEGAGRLAPLCRGCGALRSTHRCRDCGGSFELSASGQLFFTQKGLSLPRKCKPCRDKNKSRP